MKEFLILALLIVVVLFAIAIIVYSALAYAIEKADREED